MSTTAEGRVLFPIYHQAVNKYRKCQIFMVKRGENVCERDTTGFGSTYGSKRGASFLSQSCWIVRDGPFDF